MYTYGAQYQNVDTPPVEEPRKRRFPYVLVVALVIVALMGAFTYQMATRATGWKKQSDERAERITALEAEVKNAEVQLTTVETRVDELAAETAAAQDQRSAAELITNEATQLTGLAAVVANDLAACVEGTAEVVKIVSDYGAYDPTASLAYAEQVDKICTKALAGNDLLQSALK